MDKSPTNHPISRRVQVKRNIVQLFVQIVDANFPNVHISVTVEPETESSLLCVLILRRKYRQKMENVMKETHKKRKAKVSNFRSSNSQYRVVYKRLRQLADLSSKITG